MFLTVYLQVHQMMINHQIIIMMIWYYWIQQSVSRSFVSLHWAIMYHYQSIKINQWKISQTRRGMSLEGSKVHQLLSNRACTQQYGILHSEWYYNWEVRNVPISLCVFHILKLVEYDRSIYESFIHNKSPMLQSFRRSRCPTSF